MKRRHKKIILYLILPFVAMFIVVFSLGWYSGKNVEFMVGSTTAIITMILFMIIEIYVFKKIFLPYLTESEVLKELDQRKSEFLSILAHQLRTPLSGIKWTFNMLLSGDLGVINDDQKVFIRQGYENNQRMIGLIDDMLNADRVGSGRAKYNFTSVNVIILVNEIIKELTPLAKQKGVQIVFTERNNNPTVYGDEEKLHAAYQNLIDNAIKYTRPNGTVTITLKEKAGFLETSVSDNGIGIPGDQQKNIFSKFFRAANALREHADGSGLGLFIVKGIIEKHGGIIWFQSEENKGTTFYFTLRME